jgi:hypothetical protein
VIIRSNLSKQVLHIVDPVLFTRAVPTLKFYDTLCSAQAKAAFLIHESLSWLDHPRRELAVYAVNHTCSRLLQVKMVSVETSQIDYSVMDRNMHGLLELTLVVL